MSFTTLQHNRDTATANTVEAMWSKESLKKHQFLHIAAKVSCIRKEKANTHFFGHASVYV